jgi:hypothetical protein
VLAARSGNLRHFKKWGLEPRFGCAVSLFLVRNQSSIPGEEIGMEVSQSSPEK